MQKVLILDANQRSALAATRSLGAKGIHVVVADETTKTLAGTSRYCRESLVYPSPHQNPEAFITTLKKDSRERGIKVIFPMTEISTSLVLKHRQKFEDVSLPFVPFKTFDRLTNKWTLFELALKLGIPIPTTYFISEKQELSQIYPRLRFPVVLKPYRSKIWTNGGWISASVKYAGSVQEVEDRVAKHEYLNHHPFLIQEYIQGQGQGIFALYDQGKPVALFAHRRLREKPPSGGVSVLSESIELNPLMCAMARKILETENWHGIAMVEFKVSDDGTPYLMEVNARFWGSLQLAIDSGVDFPWLLYCLAIGHPLQKSNGYKIGVKNRWLLGDCAQLYKLLLKNETTPQLTRAEKWRSVVQFLNFFEGNTRYEVNRWNDLTPFLFELKQYSSGKMSKSH